MSDEEQLPVDTVCEYIENAIVELKVSILQNQWVYVKVEINIIV